MSVHEASKEEPSEEVKNTSKRFRLDSPSGSPRRSLLAVKSAVPIKPPPLSSPSASPGDLRQASKDVRAEKWSSAVGQYIRAEWAKGVPPIVISTRLTAKRGIRYKTQQVVGYSKRRLGIDIRKMATPSDAGVRSDDVVPALSVPNNYGIISINNVDDEEKFVIPSVDASLDVDATPLLDAAAVVGEASDLTTSSTTTARQSHRSLFGTG